MHAVDAFPIIFLAGVLTVATGYTVLQFLKAKLNLFQ